MRWVSLSCVVLALVVLTGFTGPAVGGGKKDKDKAVDTGKGGAAAVFEVSQDKNKLFRFTLKAADGTTLAMSVRGYKSRENCVKAIEDIRRVAPAAKIRDAVAKKKK